MTALLEIDRLTVAFGARPVASEVSLTIAAGETVCLVGESGSGKSITALSILGLAGDKGATARAGQVRLEGRNLAPLPAAEMNALRGRRIAMVFQEPMTALDPLFTIGAQIAEVIVAHQRLSRRAARARAQSLLEQVQIPEAAARLDQYPHQLSGGMRQRAMIAMALACGPDLLIADEPTTALDVTIQAQILELLRQVQRQSGMALLLITHDLGIAAQIADRVAVMYAGRIVERAAVRPLFERPRHPYTRGLLQSVVRLDSPRGRRLPAIQGAPPAGELPSGCRFHPRCPEASARCRVEQPPAVEVDGHEVACWHPAGGRPVVETVGRAASPLPVGPTLVETVALEKTFALPGAAPVRAVDGVSLSIRQGETFGLVGESGCGKSTLGRLLLQLERPSAGRVLFRGQEVGRSAACRREMQMVFQDPQGSLDPRWSAEDIIGEPLRVHARLGEAERRTRVRQLMTMVGLDPEQHDRPPHAFSGGQRQRLGIARAIALEPAFIVADEAVSALDVSVQSQIVNLLGDLKEGLGLTYLFIGHGLALVRHLSDRIGVMYLGRLVEVAGADELFRRPAHHYTMALIAAVPRVEPDHRPAASPVGGELPSAARPLTGCRFHPRCPAATTRCREEVPELVSIGAGHQVACHHPA